MCFETKSNTAEASLNGFKIGDRVIVSKYGINDPSSTSQYKGPGTVVAFKNEFVRVKADQSGQEGGWLPSSLSRIEKFQPGDRVRVTADRQLRPGYNPTHHLGSATVRNTTLDGSVIVAFDQSNKIVTWDASSLERVPSEPLAAIVIDHTKTPAVVTQIPVSQTVSRTKQVVYLAKNLARQLGIDKRYVHADLVQAELEKLGYRSSDLGNAAGTLFRSSDWKSTGKFIKSARVSSNGRKIAVWEFVGSGSQSATPARPTTQSEDQFIVVFGYDPNSTPIYRSHNTATNGVSLSKQTFTKQQAEIEAEKQRKLMGYNYSVVPASRASEFN